jgi:hypothetical protein
LQWMSCEHPHHHTRRILRCATRHRRRCYRALTRDRSRAGHLDPTLQHPLRDQEGRQPATTWRPSAIGPLGQARFALLDCPPPVPRSGPDSPAGFLGQRSSTANDVAARHLFLVRHQLAAADLRRLCRHQGGGRGHDQHSRQGAARQEHHR